MGKINAPAIIQVVPCINHSVNFSRMEKEFTSQRELERHVTFMVEKGPNPSDGSLALFPLRKEQLPETGADAYECLAWLPELVKSEFVVGDRESDSAKRFSKDEFHRACERMAKTKFTNDTQPKMGIAAGNRRSIIALVVYMLFGDVPPLPYTTIENDEKAILEENLRENARHNLSKKADLGGYIKTAKLLLSNERGLSESEVAKRLSIPTSERATVQRIYGAARYLVNHPNDESAFFANELHNKLQSKDASKVKVAKSIDELKKLVGVKESPPMNKTEIRRQATEAANAANPVIKALLLLGIIGNDKNLVAEVLTQASLDDEAFVMKMEDLIEKKLGTTPDQESDAEVAENAEPETVEAES